MTRPNLTVAKRVLGFVKLPEGAKVKRYDNCREQGYCIRLGDFAVSFSEHRSSDHVVVYSGEGFDSKGVPTDEAAERATFFRPQHEEAAATCINGMLAVHAAQKQRPRVPPLEAKVTINGFTLNTAQSMALRVLVDWRLEALQDPTLLGDDDHGRAMVKLYRERTEEIQRFLRAAWG